ncbi:C-type lectin domain family 4 member F-like [Plectropomus leopardus]|uniref:C-type lectin domain family 4 member F-like n=1 Tax=Plectropomus leopardus TaxID=160734 RepID=UPI001C4CA2CB|nr:C-type lectin domain family 4 member F-like [Plectropomus leopardus]
MEMVFHEEEPEILMITENLHDASAEKPDSKSRFVEDSEVSAAVPGTEEVGNSCCRDTAVFLLCLISLSGLILSVSSISLFFYMSKTVARRNSENNLMRQRDQSDTSYNNLTNENEQLQKKIKALTIDRNDLQRKLEDIEASYKNLTEESEKLRRNLDGFSSEGWVYFRGSFYNISSAEKTWQDSRQDCLQKGADLVIINSKEEQDFTRKFEKYMWIGLTDSETEGVWKWVDGTPLIESYWHSEEPNNKENEDCAETKYHTDEKNWNDGVCSLSHVWMCIEESCKNLTEDGEDLRKKLSNFASQQSSWARERDELKRKLDDLGTRQNTLTGERNELKRKLNDFASQQRSWAREREELKRKLSDSASQQSSLTRERDKLQKKVNDFAVYLPQGWVFFGGSLYLTSSIKKTWQDSRDDCVHRGAKLMIINSYEEQEFARKNKKTMWIGLSDRATEGVWRWVDETPLITSFWGKGEPNNYEGRNEDCVAVNYHGDTNNWNDLECGSENFWICELKMDL